MRQIIFRYFLGCKVLGGSFAITQLVITTGIMDNIVTVIGDDRKLTWNVREGCLAPGIAAFIAGLTIYVLLFHPFLTYSRRAQGLVNFVAFACSAFVVAIVIGLISRRHPFLASMCMVGTICIAHFVRIIVDWFSDPTAHNLFPFEFALILFVGAPPALAGSGIGKLLSRTLSSRENRR
jgi:hypothetical protein